MSSKTKLSQLETDPDLSDRMRKMLQRTPYASEACRAIGLPIATHKRWMIWGKDEANEPYASYRKMVRETMGKTKLAMVKTVMISARTDPQIAIAALERIDPKRWGRKDRLAVEGRLHLSQGDIDRIKAFQKKPDSELERIIAEGKAKEAAAAASPAAAPDGEPSIEVGEDGKITVYGIDPEALRAMLTKR